MPTPPSYVQVGEYHLPPGTDVQVGDTVTGAGILPGTTVDTVSIVIAAAGPWNGYSITSTYIKITLNQLISTGDAGVNNHNYNVMTSAVTGLDYGGWSSTLSFSRLEPVTEPDPIIYLSGSTLSFREDIKGWVSFKSFTPDNTISCANEYYSFTSSAINNDKGLWIHHDEAVNRNTFYNVYTPSLVSVIFNEIPGSVKSFRALNYEGSQARILENREHGVIVEDGEYYNLTQVDGWFVNSTFTNLESGGISEFIEKEGKWFGYFTGIDANINSSALVIDNYNTADFSVQGIGGLTSVSTAVIYGCMDEVFENYNPSATFSDGNCIAFVDGCMDAPASNYDPLATFDDGSCYYLGCLDPTAFNYDATATVDDGSCIPTIIGCTDINMYNYNPSANVSGSGVYDAATNPNGCATYAFGCIDPLANNYDSLANTDDGSCGYGGCMDSGFLVLASGDAYDSPNTGIPACNYDASATIDDGSCTYCGDLLAQNYDAGTCNDACIYCMPPTNIVFSNETDTSFTMVFDEPVSPAAPVIDFWIQPAISNSNGSSIWNVNASNGTTAGYSGWGTGTITYNITGITPVTGSSSQNINLTITSQCGATSSAPAASVLTLPPSILLGCTDDDGTLYGEAYGACNFNALANTDDGSCVFDTCVGCTDMTYLEGCDDCWDAVNQVVVTDGSGGAWVANDPSLCITLPFMGCTDGTANNWEFDADATHGDNGTCRYCATSWNNNDGAETFIFDNITDVELGMNFVAPFDNGNDPLYANNTHWDYTAYNGGGSVPGGSGSGLTYLGLTPNTPYTFTLQGVCFNSGVSQGNSGAVGAYGPVVSITTTTLPPAVAGCMDDGNMDSSYTNNGNGNSGSITTGSFFTGNNAGTPAYNYNSLATADDGSCNYTLQIGDTYEGGVVYYLDSGTGTGITVSPEIDTSSPSWGCEGTAITNLGFWTGHGAQNTIDILASCSEAFIAAKLANDLEVIATDPYDASTNTITGWHLPSYGELMDALNIIGLNIAITTVNSNGTSNLNAANFELNKYYWASNEAGAYYGYVFQATAGISAAQNVTKDLTVINGQATSYRAFRNITYAYQV